MELDNEAAPKMGHPIVWGWFKKDKRVLGWPGLF